MAKARFEQPNPTKATNARRDTVLTTLSMHDQVSKFYKHIKHNDKINKRKVFLIMTFAYLYSRVKMTEMEMELASKRSFTKSNKRMLGNKEARSDARKAIISSN
jgi:hypothetical protein